MATRLCGAGEPGSGTASLPFSVTWRIVRGTMVATAAGATAGTKWASATGVPVVHHIAYVNPDALSLPGRYRLRLMAYRGAYQALEEGMTEPDAVRFADGTIRQTQGSTLPEDVSRIETGPAYARVFTQFIGYFNMLANTNATAVQQVARDIGLRKGAGKALPIVFFGLLAPAWIAEAIAQAFRGGPGDDDGDGSFLDDWLASVFGMGTLKTVLAGIPFVGQFALAGINSFNSKPYDDRISTSPAISSGLRPQRSDSGP